MPRDRKSQLRRVALRRLRNFSPECVAGVAVLGTEIPFLVPVDGSIDVLEDRLSSLSDASRANRTSPQLKARGEHGEAMSCVRAH